MITPQQRAIQLQMIRFSMAGGIALFAGVIWFLHRQAPPAAPVPPSLWLLPAVVVPAGALGVLLIRLVWSTRPRSSDRAPLAVIGWAVGEAPALAGCIYYFFTDDPRWVVGGAFVLLLSFLLLPLRQTD